MRCYKCFVSSLLSESFFTKKLFSNCFSSATFFIEMPAKMVDRLKEAIEFSFDLNLWPTDFIKGVSLVSAKHRLNMDSVVLAQIVGTSAFLGKTQIRIEGGDKFEVGSVWACNVQVLFVLIFYLFF